MFRNHTTSFSKKYSNKLGCFIFLFIYFFFIDLPNLLPSSRKPLLFLFFLFYTSTRHHFFSLFLPCRLAPPARENERRKKILPLVKINYVTIYHSRLLLFFCEKINKFNVSPHPPLPFTHIYSYSKGKNKRKSPLPWYSFITSDQVHQFFFQVFRANDVSRTNETYRFSFLFFSLHICVVFFFFEPRALTFQVFVFSVSHQHFTHKKFTHTDITLIITVASENHGRVVTTHTRPHAHAVSRHPSIHLSIWGGGREREERGEKGKKKFRRLVIITWRAFFSFPSGSHYPGLTATILPLSALPYV